MTKRLTTQEFIEKASFLHQGQYIYDKVVYTVSSAKITVGCPLHGYFEVTANNHISKSNLCGCPICGGTRKLSKNEFLARAIKVHGHKYNYSKIVYDGTQKHITIICPEHGEFRQTPTRHMNGRGCHKCGGTKKISIKEAIIKAIGIHKGIYSYNKVDLTSDYSDTVIITCPKHGDFEQSMKFHLSRKWGCPVCSYRSSKNEVEISEYISQYVNIIPRERNILKPKEIDIWIPSLKIGIEYHGLYWHTTTKIGFAHREKWEMAQKAGIRLIQIFEDEWLEKQDIVKARLLAFLGKAEKRDARKLTIKTIEWSEAKTFLHKTHIQGSGPSGAAYGLYDADLLVAVATFGKSRSGAMTGAKTEGEYEVLRYASIGVVRGGFTKLLAKFIKNYSPTRLISYCDLRYGTGNLYEKAGFKLECITPPDYWWVPKGQIRRIPRYATQKHKLANSSHEFHKFYAPDKTERQICEEAELEKIHGVGSQKWVWKPSFL